MDIQARTSLVEDLHLVTFLVILHRRSSFAVECPNVGVADQDSLLRAAHEKHALASATMGGSCPHPDQSWNWLAALRSADLWVEASLPILLYSTLFHHGWCLPYMTVLDECDQPFGSHLLSVTSSFFNLQSC